MQRKSDPLQWPVALPAELHTESVSLHRYVPADAAGLFDALSDERVWEHMSHGAPADVGTLDEIIRAKLGTGFQVTFTVREGERTVGITSIAFDPDDPDGVEIGGTLLDPRVWGTGVNTQVKRLLIDELFGAGAAWIQLRTDERNGRSAAAIRKLGATDLGLRDEPHVRRDGSPRRSRLFRLERDPS